MSGNCVIFDLFGTLVPCITRAAQQELLADLARLLRLDLGELIRVWTRTANDRSTGAGQSLADVMEQIVRKLGGDSDGVVDAVAARRDYVKQALEPRAETLEVLQELRRAGYQTALISNCSMEVPTLWRDCQMAPFVDATVFSAEVGATKPDPAIYQCALDSVGLRPRACLYVADGDSGELAGAAAVGIRAVQLYCARERGFAFLRAAEEHWGGSAITSLTDILRLARLPRS